MLFSFLYMCIAVGDTIIKRERVGIPFTSLTVSHFCASPKPGPGFPILYVVDFVCVFSELRREMIVCFVDTGGIVNHHCLNFLLVI